MTAIERTAYPRFTRAPSVKELREIYTPTPGDVAFVATQARGPSQKFALMILLKVYQRLHYFPEPQTIPGAVISHIRAVMKLSSDVVPDIAPATLYRYRTALRAHFEITVSQGQQVRHIVAEAMLQAVQVMNNPADIINASIETMLAQRCELPAFSTLDRMAQRVRTLVNGGIYRRILARLSENEQQTLSALLRAEEASLFTPFNQVKEIPKSATLTHLDDWLSRLTWLQSLGNTSNWLDGIRSKKIMHLAEEARSLHASDFPDFLPPKRFALLVCLIHQATRETRDQIVEMFIKRISKLTAKAKEELERLREEDRTATERLIEVFADVLQTNSEVESAETAGSQIRKILEDAGGTTRLLEQCEQVSAHHGDRHQPLVWRFYSSHRKTLFRVIKTLDLSSTTSDQALIDAMNFLITHEHDPK